MMSSSSSRSPDFSADSRSSRVTLGRRWARVAVYDWRGLVRAVPPGLQLLVVGAALYAWMNFVLCLLLDLPAAAQPAITLRMASGHLIFFFLVPLVFFRWVDTPIPFR